MAIQSKKNEVDKQAMMAWGGGLALMVALPIVAYFFLRSEKTLFEVSGQVLRAGKPIEMADCRITFLNPDKGIFAPAKIEPDGKFRVFNYQESGLPPGNYEVVVSFPAGYLPPTDPRDPLKPLPPDELERRLGKFIPKKYRDPKTSGLKLTLTDQDAEFNVDMKDGA